MGLAMILRSACADLPALPLQLALLEHEEWRDDPVVILEEHKPLARILWANRPARQHRIHRGMRFGAAQALSARLRATVVTNKQLEDAVERIFRGLLAYSPRVEPSFEWPGLFWIDPVGLSSIFGSLEQWATDLHQYLAGLGFIAAVVVGSQRFSVFALARTTTGPHVVRDPMRETHAAQQVPLARLNLTPKLLKEMSVLGVHTLGDLVRLPGHELRVRYGEEAETLHRLAVGRTWKPLEPHELHEPVRAELSVEPPDDNHRRLLFGVKSKLHQVIEQLVKRCEAITALTLVLKLDHAETRSERVEMASPTLDVAQVSDLIRLRFAALQLAAPIEHITVIVDSIRVHPQQIDLLQERKRDLNGAARALARIKATFGRESVARAVLRNAILPEARYHWQPLCELTHPEPRLSVQPRMVRRVFQEPALLPAVPKTEPGRWLGTHGAVAQMFGPHRLDGGWWRRRVTRDYYFVETKTGELLWIYYDTPKRCWKLHGWVD